MENEIKERLIRIEILQAAQNDQLREHMRRSDLLETRQNMDREVVQKTISAVEKIEARNSVIFALGAGLLPLAALLVQLWKAFH